MPKVSILVPIYNVESYLRACLDSIMAQTYKDFEAVLVDDGSIDKSGAICDEYAQRDPRFVVVHKKNEGVAKARITAFEHSTGELITFIDADDYVSPEYVEKLSKPILEDGADMVSCDYSRVINGEIKDSRAKQIGTYDNKQIREFIDKYYFFDGVSKNYGMTCFLCTKMVCRDFVLEGLRNGVGLWFGEDQISMFTMLLLCHKLVLIPDRLYYYIQHEGQVTKRYDESLWENIIQLLSRYQTMLPLGVGYEGLGKRTWQYIRRTIEQKMVASGITMSAFCDHLSKVREHPYMQNYFKSSTTGFGLRDDIKYWLLKFGWLRLYYWLYMCRYIKCNGL